VRSYSSHNNVVTHLIETFCGGAQLASAHAGVQLTETCREPSEERALLDYM
jgi:hypothetical protein